MQVGWDSGIFNPIHRTSLGFICTRLRVVLHSFISRYCPKSINLLLHDFDTIDYVTSNFETNVSDVSPAMVSQLCLWYVKYTLVECRRNEHIHGNMPP